MLRRRRRNHRRVRVAANGRPRLSIFRSNCHIYAQVIDDVSGRTVASASTLDRALRSESGRGIAAARAVGALVAQRSKEAGIDTVVFDRGSYLYHGRVRALAEAAREGGLGF
jgi:large subunit ribosomal protein L18